MSAAERAFVQRFRARFGADAALLTRGRGSQADQQAGELAGAGHERDAAAWGKEVDRLLPRLGSDSRRKRRPGAAPTALPGSVGASRSPDLLRRFLWTLFRRFAGSLLVRGRLLNLEELLVTHFTRAESASKAADSGRNPCIRINEDSLRLIVRCVGAQASQIGRDAVLARVVAPQDVDAELLVAEDASERDDAALGSSQPIAVVTPLVEEEGAWTNEQVLGDMPAVYGFDISAFASAELSVVSDQSDDEAPLTPRLMSTSLFHDLRGSDKMMEALHVSPHVFQSFAWAATLARRPQPKEHAADAGGSVAKGGNNEPDPWSYRELDGAQKRKWADERFEYGLELVGKQKVREAVAEFESALKLNERHAGALAAKGRAHLAARQFHDAVDCLERAAEVDPTLITVQDDLLRAKGMLAHSRHVASGSGYAVNGERRGWDRAGATRAKSPPPTRTKSRSAGRERSRQEDRRAARSTSSAKTLEDERLRLLLEEDERQRRRSRQSRRRRQSDSESSSNSSSSSSERGRSRERGRSSSKKRKRERKHKREKRKHKKNDGKRKSKRHDSAYASSDSHSSRSTGASRRSHRHRSLGDSSRDRGEEGKTSDLPAILARTKHRIWN